MCGIFGVVGDSGGAKYRRHKLNQLAKMSKRRGSDSAGFISISKTDINIFRGNLEIRKQVNRVRLQRDFPSSYFNAGFTRLGTHGVGLSQNSSQPVNLDHLYVIHNGIVTNYTSFVDAQDIDSLAIPFFISAKVSDLEFSEANLNFLNQSLQELEGEITFIAASANGFVFAYSNVGNLYTAHDKFGNVWFASEEFFLKKLNFSNVKQMKISNIQILCRGDGSVRKQNIVNFDDNNSENLVKIERRESDDIDNIQPQLDLINTLMEKRKFTRCTKCILPSTFPGIYFDIDGCCNLCVAWKEPSAKGIDQLHQDLSLIIPENGFVQVNLSGGRDSSYMLIRLHELGYKIKAVTYDWGFVTTSARENMARICGALGVEHIVVSPNINKNRRLVRECLRGWFRLPTAGTIPALMAGDKLLFSTGLKISDENGSIPIILGDHWLETTGFKSALAGAKYDGNSSSAGVAYRLSISQVFRMSFSYFKLISKINRFRIATAIQLFRSAYIYYFLDHRLFHFFEYETWQEDKIESKIREYGWQPNKGNSGTNWRMGDSTAPFYNFLYLILIGFTENDALRSNQIRFGELTRDQGLTLIARDNRLDVTGINSYLDLVGIHPREFWQEALPNLVKRTIQKLQ